jgi:hypothetical protein
MFIAVETGIRRWLHALRPIASLSFTLEAVGYGSVRSNLRT